MTVGGVSSQVSGTDPARAVTCVAPTVSTPKLAGRVCGSYVPGRRQPLRSRPAHILPTICPQNA